MTPVFVPQSQAVNPKEIFRPDDNPNRMTVEDYDGLKTYIKKRGFLQPALITPTTDEPTDLPYVVVDGDHRVRIALELTMPVISAVVVDATEAERIRDRLAMNKRRGQLDVVAAGRDLARLLKEFEYGPDEIADTGFSNEETLELLDALKPATGEEALRDGMSLPPTDEIETPDKKWKLNLQFDSEAERARVRAKVLEFADGKSLATGALRMVEALDNATDA